MVTQYKTKSLPVNFPWVLNQNRQGKKKWSWTTALEKLEIQFVLRNRSVRNAFLVDENWRQKYGNEDFSWAIFFKRFSRTYKDTHWVSLRYRNQEQKKTKKKFCDLFLALANKKNLKRTTDAEKKRANKRRKNDKANNIRHTS